MSKKYKKGLKIILFPLLIFVAGWNVIYLYNSMSLALSIKELDPVLLNSSKQQQYELVLVYIGSSSCPASNHKDLPHAFSFIKESLKSQAQQYGYSFHTIGISKNEVFTEELIHLTKYGRFDEILIGNDWSNTGILKYMYNDFPGPVAVPQIVITKRKFKTTVNVSGTNYYGGLDNEYMLVRKVGTQEIIEYAKMDAPLPTDAFDIDF